MKRRSSQLRGWLRPNILDWTAVASPLKYVTFDVTGPSFARALSPVGLIISGMEINHKACQDRYTTFDID